MYFEFSGRGGAWRRSCCGWQGGGRSEGVYCVCAVAVWFAATHRAKCIKYAERDEFLYMMLVGDVTVPVYDKPCLVYESEVQK